MNLYLLGLFQREVISLAFDEVADREYLGSVWIYGDNDYLSSFRFKLSLMHLNMWDNFGLK